MSDGVICALVDYDNVKQLRRERNREDVSVNLFEILEAVTRCAVAVNVARNDRLLLRLYGGWIDMASRETLLATWIKSEIPRLRTRRYGIRVAPSLVTSLSIRPGSNLVGTYRSADEPAQKMVDAMLSADAFHFLQLGDTVLLVVSDDDDFVPMLVAGSSMRDPRHCLFLVRRSKQPGAAPNDGLLSTCGLRILTC